MVLIKWLFVYSGMRHRREQGCMLAKPQCTGLDCEMVKVFRVDYDFVAEIGGLLMGEVGVLGGAFGDRLVGGMVSMLSILFRQVDLEILYESVLEGVF